MWRWLRSTAAARPKDEAPLTLDELRAQGLLEYIAFPEALKGKYQGYTQADLTKLREAGYDAPMATVEEGVAQLHGVAARECIRRWRTSSATRRWCG